MAHKQKVSTAVEKDLGIRICEVSRKCNVIGQQVKAFEKMAAFWSLLPTLLNLNIVEGDQKYK